MRAGARALAAVTMAATSITMFAGCALLSPDAQAAAQMRQSLAESVTSAQDSVWDFRHELRADPEGALAQGLWGFSDARPFVGRPDEAPPGTWKLYDLATDDGGTTLTLVATARADTGGGLFTGSSSGATCVRLRVTPDASRVETDRSDCALPDGRRFFTPAPGVRLIPVTDLDVDRIVDASDHPPLPCQCSSGEPCECPGG